MSELLIFGILQDVVDIAMETSRHDVAVAKELLLSWGCQTSALGSPPAAAPFSGIAPATVVSGNSALGSCATAPSNAVFLTFRASAAAAAAASAAASISHASAAVAVANEAIRVAAAKILEAASAVSEAAAGPSGFASNLDHTLDQSRAPLPAALNLATRLLNESEASAARVSASFFDATAFIRSISEAFAATPTLNSISARESTSSNAGSSPASSAASRSHQLQSRPFNFSGASAAIDFAASNCNILRPNPFGFTYNPFESSSNAFFVTSASSNPFLIASSGSFALSYPFIAASSSMTNPFGTGASHMTNAFGAASFSSSIPTSSNHFLVASSGSPAGSIFAAFAPALSNPFIAASSSMTNPFGTGASHMTNAFGAASFNSSITVGSEVSSWWLRPVQSSNPQ